MTKGRKVFWLDLVLPAFVLIFLPLVHLFAPPATAERLSIKVGVYENAPKIFIDEAGHPAGIFIDVLEHIAGVENWNVYYVPGSWAQQLERLERGEIDLMPDVAYTSERDKMFSFHKEPVLSSWFQVYARKGSGIRTILDLDGKKIAVLERSVQQDALATLVDSFGLNVGLVPAPDYSKSFDMVVNGEADAAVTNSLYGPMHAGKAGLEDTAVIFNPSALFFAAPKNAFKPVLAALDAHLLDLKKDSQSVYYQSLKRWTSEQVHFKLPSWVPGVGMAAAVVLFMSLMGSIVLKRKVNSRTRSLAKRNKQMAIMDRTLRAITTELHLQPILDGTVRGALELAKVEGGALCLLERDSGRLIPGACINDFMQMSSAERRQPIPVGGCLCASAARDGEPSVHWDGVASDGDAGDTALSTRTIRFHASFPLKVRGETIGVLCIFSYDDNKPDARKLKLVQDICGPAALAIENARLYEQVLHHSEELEQRVAERTAELAVAMEKAQAADQLKSAFLATMSHELRTPLNSIIGFTGIMLQGLTGPLNDEQFKQMSMVQSSARHLLALINDVLDISKIEAGQLKLFLESFELRASIEKMVKLVSPQATKKGIVLRMEIGPEVARVYADQRRLEQVLLNLLNNAIKFTERGHVRINCQAENGDYVLSVSDTGIGIRQEELPGLFQPFHQIDTGLSRKREGSGLGLFICQKLMEMMAGSMSVESRWGEGSTFTVRFSKNQEACIETQTSDH